MNDKLLDLATSIYLDKFQDKAKWQAIKIGGENAYDKLNQELARYIDALFSEGMMRYSLLIDANNKVVNKDKIGEEIFDKMVKLLNIGRRQKIGVGEQFEEGFLALNRLHNDFPLSIFNDFKSVYTQSSIFTTAAIAECEVYRFVESMGVIVCTDTQKQCLLDQLKTYFPGFDNDQYDCSSGRNFSKEDATKTRNSRTNAANEIMYGKFDCIWQAFLRTHRRIQNKDAKKFPKWAQVREAIKKKVQKDKRSNSPKEYFIFNDLYKDGFYEPYMATKLMLPAYDFRVKLDDYDSSNIIKKSSTKVGLDRFIDFKNTGDYKQKVNLSYEDIKGEETKAKHKEREQIAWAKYTQQLYGETLPLPVARPIKINVGIVEEVLTTPNILSLSISPTDSQDKAVSDKIIQSLNLSEFKKIKKKAINMDETVYYLHSIILYSGLHFKTVFYDNASDNWFNFDSLGNNTSSSVNSTLKVGNFRLFRMFYTQAPTRINYREQQQLRQSPNACWWYSLAMSLVNLRTKNGKLLKYLRNIGNAETIAKGIKTLGDNVKLSVEEQLKNLKLKHDDDFKQFVDELPVGNDELYKYGMEIYKRLNEGYAVSPSSFTWIEQRQAKPNLETSELKNVLNCGMEKLTKITNTMAFRKKNEDYIITIKRLDTFEIDITRIEKEFKLGENDTAPVVPSHGLVCLVKVVEMKEIRDNRFAVYKCQLLLTSPNSHKSLLNVTFKRTPLDTYYEKEILREYFYEENGNYFVDVYDGIDWWLTSTFVRSSIRKEYNKAHKKKEKNFHSFGVFGWWEKRDWKVETKKKENDNRIKYSYKQFYSSKIIQLDQKSNRYCLDEGAIFQLDGLYYEVGKDYSSVGITRNEIIRLHKEVQDSKSKVTLELVKLMSVFRIYPLHYRHFCGIPHMFRQKGNTLFFKLELDEEVKKVISGLLRLIYYTIKERTIKLTVEKRPGFHQKNIKSNMQTRLYLTKENMEKFVSEYLKTIMKDKKKTFINRFSLYSSMKVFGTKQSPVMTEEVESVYGLIQLLYGFIFQIYAFLKKEKDN